MTRVTTMFVQQHVTNATVFFFERYNRYADVLLTLTQDVAVGRSSE